MEVPDSAVAPPPRRAEMMSRPGAKTSTQLPKFEKDARASLRSLAPTVRAWSTRAGEVLQASWLSFPAAIA